jgi:hypothetical protein
VKDVFCPAKTHPSPGDPGDVLPPTPWNELSFSFEESIEKKKIAYLGGSKQFFEQYKTRTRTKRGSD